MRDRETAQFQHPQVNLARSTQARMWIAAVSALGAAAQSAVTDGGRSLLLAAVTAVTAALAEVAARAIRCGRLPKSPAETGLCDGSALVTGFVLAMLLPNRIPLVPAALGALFAIVVVKQSFGGLGTNWLNPALGGWLFVRFSWPALMTDALAASPLLSQRWQTGSFDAPVTGVLNRFVLKPLGSQMPSGYVSLFSLPDAGIVADRAVLMLLIGSIIITTMQANKAWVGALYLGVYLLMVRATGALHVGGLSGGDMLWTLFSGGTLAVAFFLLADVGVGPKTNSGTALCACLAAVLSWYFRYIQNEPYGAFYAVACLNAFTPLVRQIESSYFYERRGQA